MKFYFIVAFLATMISASENFGFVDLTQTDQRSSFFIVGSFYEGAHAILEFLNDNGVEQIGDLTPVEIYDGWFLIGGVYRNQHGVFRLLLISDLQSDPDAANQQLLQGDVQSLSLKSVFLINLYGENDEFFLKLFKSYQTDVDARYTANITSNEQIRKLRSYQVDKMVIKLLERSRSDEIEENSVDEK